MRLTHRDRRSNRKVELVLEGDHHALEIAVVGKNVVMTAQVIRNNAERTNDLDLCTKLTRDRVDIDPVDVCEEIAQSEKPARLVAQPSKIAGRRKGRAARDVEVDSDSDMGLRCTSPINRVTGTGIIGEGAHRRDLATVNRLKNSAVNPFGCAKVIRRHDETPMWNWRFCGYHFDQPLGLTYVSVVV